MKYRLFLFSILLSSCRAGLDSATQEIDDRSNYYEAVLVENHSPAMRAVDVDLLADIVVTFSGPINRSSVDSLSFKVLDESGREIQGLINYSNNNRTLTFVRTVLNQKAPWDMSSTYLVRMQYILGENGREIAPYDFEFRTAGVGTASGNFKLMKIEPNDFLIFPDAAFDMIMSEPIHLNNGVCSNSKWRNAYKFYLVGGSGQLQLTTLEGKICSICRTSTLDEQVKYGIAATVKVCDKLRFRPTTTIPGERYLHVEYQPEAATDLVSYRGERAKGKVSKDYFVMFSGL